MCKIHALRTSLALSLYTTTAFCGSFIDCSQIKFISALSEGIGKTSHFIQKNKAACFVAAVSGAFLLKSAYSKYKSYCNQQLLLAVERNDISKVRISITAGADVNTRNKEGLTPLHIAAANLNTEIVNILIAAGADSNAFTFSPLSCTETPLDKTLTANLSRTRANGSPVNLDVVDALIAHTNVNTVNYTHDTALHRVVKTAISLKEILPEGGYELCAQYAHKLINAGASLTAKNMSLFPMLPGRTPLQEAIKPLGLENPLTQLLLKAQTQRVVSETMARALHPRLGHESPAALIPQHLMHNICQFAS